MIKDDCIFCKIANGEIPSYSIFEDDNFKVILDIEPSSKGHSLIIPKAHADNLFELDKNVAEKALIVAKKAAAGLKKTLKCPGINILQNNGAAAGQTVNHYHIHIIPRYDNDNVNISWMHETFNKDTADAFVNDVKSNID